MPDLGHARDADCIMIDGRNVVECGDVAGIDEDALLCEAGSVIAATCCVAVAERRGGYAAPPPEGIR